MVSFKIYVVCNRCGKESHYGNYSPEEIKNWPALLRDFGWSVDPIEQIFCPDCCKPTYRIGDKFIKDDPLSGKSRWIIAFCGQGKRTLICIDTGGYWSGIIEPKSSESITQEEFNIMAGDDSEQFRKVESWT